MVRSRPATGSDGARSHSVGRPHGDPGSHLHTGQSTKAERRGQEPRCPGDGRGRRRWRPTERERKGGKQKSSHRKGERQGEKGEDSVTKERNGTKASHETEQGRGKGDRKWKDKEMNGPAEYGDEEGVFVLGEKGGGPLGRPGRGRESAQGHSAIDNHG
ncbi:hypothetical protein EMCRGX_G001193 [Ephydatia muelleri]